MAKILIYPAHQVGGLTTLIKNSGHIPIYLQESLFSLQYISENIGLPGFGDDDVLLIICTLLDAHVSPSIVPNAKEINEAGYILTMGQTNYGTAGHISLTYNLGLSHTLEQSRGEGNLILTTNKVIKNEILKEKGFIGINRTIAACRDLLTPTIVIGYSSALGDPLVVVWEVGVTTLTGFRLLAPIIYFSFTWSFVYNSDWLLFFNDLLNYCKLMIKAPYQVSGTVKDLEGNPLIRNVVAYSSKSFELLQKTITNELGEYLLRLPTQDKITVMFIPEETEKPEVHFNVIPQENVEE